MFEEIDEICDGIGCSRNDWIKDALKDKLREEINDLTNKNEEQKPQKITITPISDDEPFRPSKGVQVISI